MIRHRIAGHDRLLNWKRQPTDLRDLKLQHVQAMSPPSSLPSSATTKGIASPAIRNQLNLGSCTQNAGAEAMAFLYMVAHRAPDPMFSRLYGYFFTRALEGTPADQDSGCNVRDVFKAYRRWGICFEATWPYDVAQFSAEPSEAAQVEARGHRATSFYGLDMLDAIRQSIADGWPAIFGFDCFESLTSDAVTKSGAIPMPGPSEASIGGHCMYLDSYDDERKLVGGINSWGPDWGDGGRFTLPYDYWTQGLASDATTLRVELG